MGVQADQLLRIERTSATADTGADTTQRLDTTFAIALEMVAHGVGLDLQDFGDVLRRPTGGKKYHRLDAVGLALVLRAAVRRTQLGELVG